MEEPNDVTADRLLRELLMPGRNSSNATIHVNAGGMGIWVATTACIVMLAVSAMLAVLYIDVRDEQRMTAAHLQTIYMLVPELRKLVDEKNKNNPH